MPRSAAMRMLSGNPNRLHRVRFWEAHRPCRRPNLPMSAARFYDYDRSHWRTCCARSAWSHPSRRFPSRTFVFPYMPSITYRGSQFWARSRRSCGPACPPQIVLRPNYRHQVAAFRRSGVALDQRLVMTPRRTRLIRTFQRLREDDVEVADLASGAPWCSRSRSPGKAIDCEQSIIPIEPFLTPRGRIRNGMEGLRGVR